MGFRTLTITQPAAMRKCKKIPKFLYTFSTLPINLCKIVRLHSLNPVLPKNLTFFRNKTL